MHPITLMLTRDQIEILDLRGERAAFPQLVMRASAFLRDLNPGVVGVIQTTDENVAYRSRRSLSRPVSPSEIRLGRVTWDSGNFDTPHGERVLDIQLEI